MLANGVKPEDARVCSFPSLIRCLFNRPLQLVYVILNTCGADQRQEDIFSNSSLLAKGRSVLKGIKVSFLVL
jgi:vacuolar protein sorting-associated protein 45